jgi:tetratricopeptide (TPR) repeat protein
LRKALEVDQANSRAKSVARQLAQALADRAGKWRNERKLSDAQGAVLNALELDPGNAAANGLAKRIAQDYALLAANLLDEGKEAEARASLDAARRLDTKNELANTLYGSLTVDPEQEFGTKFFRYTVKPGDKLSRIAEVYLKDQYKFYLLARYNSIAVPRGLKAGQIIKVPGTKPPQSPPPPPPPPPPRPPEGQQLCPAPANRAEWIQRYDRQARDCYRRQELDCCITAWDKVLQLDPANETAERERDRCVRLREILETK